MGAGAGSGQRPQGCSCPGERRAAAGSGVLPGRVGRPGCVCGRCFCLLSLYYFFFPFFFKRKGGEKINGAAAGRTFCRWMSGCAAASWARARPLLAEPPLPSCCSSAADNKSPAPSARSLRRRPKPGGGCVSPGPCIAAPARHSRAGTGGAVHNQQPPHTRAAASPG